MNCILDIERACITENAEPILEASFNDEKSINALKLASKSIELLEMLRSVVELQELNYGNATNTHLKMINKAKDIKELIKNINV